MNKFQVILIVCFILFTIVGVLMFAGVIPTPGGGGGGGKGGVKKFVLWGTIPRNSINQVLGSFNKDDAYAKTYSLSYIEKNEETLEIDLLRALQDGTAPDLVLFPHEYLLALKSHLYIIPTSSIDERTFKELFVEGGEVFIGKDGISALPIFIDPLTLYWNRDILNSERITETPKDWSDVLLLGSTVSKRDSRGKILQSAIPLGTSKNITHAKEILSLLVMQTGDDIVHIGSVTREPQVVFGSNVPGEGTRSSAESALEYYVGFADPARANYSWNSSLQSSIDAFAEGTAAFYIGFASDYTRIKSKNPHLNFDVAEVPQLEASARDLTYGRIYGIAAIKDSSRLSDVFPFLFTVAITDPKIQGWFSDAVFLPPAKRALISVRKEDPIMATLYKSAIIARGWLDPNPEATRAIFGKMMEDVSAKITNSSSAIQQAQARLKNEFR